MCDQPDPIRLRANQAKKNKVALSTTASIREKTSRNARGVIPLSSSKGLIFLKNSQPYVPVLFLMSAQAHAVNQHRACT